MSRSTSQEAFKAGRIFNLTEAQEPQSSKLPTILHSFTPSTANPYKSKNSRFSRNRANSRPFTTASSNRQSGHLGNLLEKISSGSSRHSGSHKLLHFELNELENSVLSKKKACNALQFDIQRAECSLKRLHSEFAALSKQSVSNEELRGKSEVITEQRAEIANGLENELFYQGILGFMMNSRKTTSHSLDEPISCLKDKLKEVNSKLRDSEKLREEYTNEYKNSIVQMKRLAAETSKEAECRTKIRHRDALTKEEQLLACEALQQEHLRNNKEESLKEKQGLLKAATALTRQLEAEERALAAAQSAQLAYEPISRQIKDIKEATQISSIKQLKTYYKYLRDSNRLLRTEMKEAVTREKTLSDELARVHEELNKAVQQQEDTREIHPQKQEQMEYELTKKNRDIDEIEKILEKLNLLITFSCSTISRISTQLAEDNTIINCKPRKAVALLRKSSRDLELRLQEVGRRAVDNQSESINTSFHSNSPAWLKLLSKNST